MFLVLLFRTVQLLLDLAVVLVPYCLVVLLEVVPRVAWVLPRVLVVLRLVRTVRSRLEGSELRQVPVRFLLDSDHPMVPLVLVEVPLVAQVLRLELDCRRMPRVVPWTAVVAVWVEPSHDQSLSASSLTPHVHPPPRP